jgi:hypothetical protein
MSNAVWAKNIHQEIAFWEGVIRRTAASQSGAPLFPRRQITR